MSRRKDDFLIPLNIAETLEICQKVVADAGWLVLDHGETSITAKEPGVMNLNLGTWSVTLRIECVNTSGGTIINIKGKNLGFGPIQSKHVVGQIGRFRNLIELAVIAKKKKE